MGLTKIQERFVEEYLIDFNGTQAAIRAGYAPKSAASRAWRLLQRHEVQVAISAQREMLVQVAQVTQEEVVEGYRNIAFFDPAECFDESGNILRLDKMPKAVRYAIASIDVERRREGRGEENEVITVKKIRFWPRPDALDALGRYLGLFNADKSKQTNINVLSMILERIDGRGLPRIAGE